MSYVTNVMMQFDGLEETGDGDMPPIPGIPSDGQNLAKIQEITKRLCNGTFKSLTDDKARKCWGGNKVVQCEIIAGAFNYFPLDEWLEEIEKLEWHYPEKLRIFTHGEDSVAFGVWILPSGGKMFCVLEEEYD